MFYSKIFGNEPCPSSNKASINNISLLLASFTLVTITYFNIVTFNYIQILDDIHIFHQLSKNKINIYISQVYKINIL